MPNPNDASSAYDWQQVVTVQTYNLEAEVLAAARSCATRDEVKGIIRANGKMISRQCKKELETIAKGKPKTSRYVEPKVTVAPAVKTCSEGPDYVWQETGTTTADEARWLDPWGR